jgi:hypothetical protein
LQSTFHECLSISDVSREFSWWSQGLPNNLVVEPGSTVNLNLDFTLGDPTGTADPPDFSAWIRRYHSPEFEQLDWSRTEQPNIQIPNSTGLYQLRVTPGIRGTNSAFQVHVPHKFRTSRWLKSVLRVYLC